MQRLTDGQKRKVLISMIYENDNKFLGLLIRFGRKENLRPTNTASAMPMARSFLRKSKKSRASYDRLVGYDKNWLNYMNDVELLHYLDFQNRVYAEMREKGVYSSEGFFSILEDDSVAFNEYYSSSSDCPKLKTKLQVPDSEKLPKSVLENPEIRNSVLLETMLKAHNLKKGTSDKSISQAVADRFKIAVKVPTLTEQVRKGLPEPEYDELDVVEQSPTPVGIVYGEPAYKWGDRFVTRSGEDVTDYIEAGELRSMDDD